MANILFTTVPRRRLIAPLLILILAPTELVSCFSQPSTPEETLERFYSNQGPEETLMDPLILEGESVVPLVIEKVKDQKMLRRRYAIGFLGNGSYKQALPVLQTILQDNSELDYFRGDALHSIYQIDEAAALKYAQSYRNETNYLGQVAQDLLTVKRLVPQRRSYWTALLGSQD